MPLTRGMIPCCIFKRARLWAVRNHWVPSVTSQVNALSPAVSCFRPICSSSVTFSTITFHLYLGNESNEREGVDLLPAILCVDTCYAPPIESDTHFVQS